MSRPNLRKFLIGSLVALVVLVAAYALFGYHYAPRLLRERAIAYTRAAYGRELGIGEVNIDPFRLRVAVHDLHLPDADGQPMLAAQRILVDFEVSSLWHRALVFSAIELDHPYVRAVQRADGQLNLVDLAHPRTLPGAAPPSARPTTPPQLWLQSLAVTAGSVEYHDATRTQPLVLRITPITLALRDFRTTAEGGRFMLAARTTADERFEWHGRIATSPNVASDGELSIAQLRLATLAELSPGPRPFAIDSGTIDLSGRYALDLGAGVGLTLDLPLLTVTNLGVGAGSTETHWVDAGRIALEQLHFDLAARSVHAARLGIEGLKARTWLGSDGRFNLLGLLPAAESTATGGPTHAASVASATSATPTRPWQGGIDALQLAAAAIDFEDRRLPAPQGVHIAPLDLATGAVSLDLSRAVPVTLTAAVNNTARLQLKGTMTPAPLAAKLDVELTDLQLQMLQPYVLPEAGLSIRSGALATAGQITLASARGGPPAIRYDGDATLTKLHTVDNLLQDDLLNLRRLEVQKLHYSSAPAGLRIARIQVDEPYTRVVISPEQIVNIGAVADPKAAAAQLARRRAAQAGGAPAASLQESRAERVPREARVKAPLPVESDAPEAFPIRIGAVQVRGGRMNFSDFSIRPNFSAEILDLHGEVKDLSTAHSSRATVDLHGNLGEFSPVTIGGTLRPFAFDRYTDIDLKFENIALPVFNPYSGEFAGYNIAKGKLTTDLHYQISDRKLNATHHIRIDQLEWGEASEFKSKATLPVRFATALLRDRNGVINLDIPVTGSLDDPKLRIGPIVWQVIKNLIVKAATSPFKLLGSLFAGAEEAQFVDFEPGDANLDAAAGERLAALARGLSEKPAISVDIPLATAPDQDRPAVAARRYQQLLDAAAPGYATLDASHQREALISWLRAHQRAVPTFPAPAAPPEGSTRAQARALADQAAVSVLEHTLRDGIVVADGDLEQLAQARAAAIQAALVRDGKLTAERVFIVRDTRLPVQDGRIRLRLELK